MVTVHLSLQLVVCSPTSSFFSDISLLNLIIHVHNCMGQKLIVVGSRMH